MTESQSPLHLTCCNLRRSKGLTQSDLAREVGCTQSAISMYEAGRAESLAEEKVRILLDILEVDINDISLPETDEGKRAESTLKYCPVDECPSNVPYVTRSQLFFKPMMIEVTVGESTLCSFCGEPLEERCPNGSCGAELREGSFCWSCCTPYVTSTRATGRNPERWADAQRARIRELRELTETRRRGPSRIPRLPG